MPSRIRSYIKLLVAFCLIVSFCLVEGEAQTRRKKRTRRTTPAAPRPVITNPPIAPPESAQSETTTGDVKIISTARDLFPNALAFDRAEHWACLRPSTPDGPPIIGHTPLRNLWTNTGHGYLGWTMCCGSAKLLTDLMSGKQPELDPAPYRYGRY